MQIPIKRFDSNFPLPTPTKGAACFDLFCRETVTIPPHQIKAVAQNAAVKVPEGYALLLFTRSSTGMRTGLMLANSVGVLDPFYSGDKDEIYGFMLNFTDKPVTVEAGDRILQGMIIRREPVSWEEVESMNDEGHGGYQHFKDAQTKVRDESR